jgi:hypothetical protein
MAVTEKTTQVAQAYGRLIEQFKGNTLMREMLRTWIEEAAELEAAGFEVLDQDSIDNAEGVQLDGIGRIVGQPRSGASDPVYRLRIKARILLNKSSGTIPQILEIFALLTAEDQAVVLAEYFPAGFYLTIGGDSGTTADNAAELVNTLDAAKAGGVGARLVYSGEPDDATFQFASGDDAEYDFDTGFGGSDEWLAFAAAAANSWSCVTYIPNRQRFVAVATTGTDQAMYSDDWGATWTAVTHPVSTLNSIAYSPTLDRLVTVGGTGAGPVVAYSDDGGETWTSLPAVTTAVRFEVIWDSYWSRFVAIGITSGTRVMWSEDGEEWNFAVAAQANNWVSLFSAAEGRIVALSATGTNRVMVSDDGGESWSVRSAASVATWQHGVRDATNERLICVAGNGDVMYSDDNGETWALQTVPEANAWTSVAWASETGVGGSGGSGRLTAVSNTGTNRIMHSDDGGDTWLSDTADANNWQFICCAEDSVLLAVATSGAERVTVNYYGSGGAFADVLEA